MEKTTASFADTEFRVMQWMDKVGILKHGTVEGQLIKLVEECKELVDAHGANNRDEIEDAIGDIMIVLVAIGALTDLDVRQCFFKAAEIVTKREGEMRSDGVFYKNA